MTLRRIFATAFCLVSVNALAGPATIHVFKSDKAPVYMDNKASAGTEVTVYSMDALQKADMFLNLRVSQDLGKPEYRGLSPKDAFMRAFSKLQNSPEWDTYYRRYQEGSEPIEKAIRYRITKLPAYVFDNEYVVYGVPSLREATAIFERKVP